VSSFRQLAANAAASVLKGQRVLVTGRVKIREWVKDDRRGVNVDVEAESIGHDLAWGTSTFSRIVTSSAEPVAQAGPASESVSESPAASQVSEPVPF
jgi:single-strand DNA-binding protein